LSELGVHMNLVYHITYITPKHKKNSSKEFVCHHDMARRALFQRSGTILF